MLHDSFNTATIRSSLCLPHWLQSSDLGSWMTWLWEALDRQSLRTWKWLWKQGPIWVWNLTLLNVNSSLTLGAVSMTRHFCLFFRSKSLRQNLQTLTVLGCIPTFLPHKREIWHGGAASCAKFHFYRSSVSLRNHNYGGPTDWLQKNAEMSFNKQCTFCLPSEWLFRRLARGRS